MSKTKTVPAQKPRRAVNLNGHDPDSFGPANKQPVLLDRDPKGLTLQEIAEIQRLAKVWKQRQANQKGHIRNLERALAVERFDSGRRIERIQAMRRVLRGDYGGS
jgi:hypothetical protein